MPLWIHLNSSGQLPSAMQVSTTLLRSRLSWLRAGSVLKYGGTSSAKKTQPVTPEGHPGGRGHRRHGNRNWSSEAGRVSDARDSKRDASRSTILLAR